MLFIGLGNPGYKKTNHNLGADTLEIIILYLASKGYTITKLDIRLYKCTINQLDYYFYISPSMMNISGAKVSKMIKKYNIKSITVLLDDLDMKPNKYKIKSNKNYQGHRGHNGMRDILQKVRTLGTEVQSILLGIGRPKDRSEVSEYVLAKTKDINYQELAMNVYNNLISKIIGVTDEKCI